MKCEGKFPFIKRTDADKAARRTRDRGYGSTMSSYRCNECGFFHIGHSHVGLKAKKKFRFKLRRK